MSRSQKAMGTPDSSWSRASQFLGRDSSASDATSSSRDDQFETDWFGRLRATAFSRRVREFSGEGSDRISNQQRFVVASGPPDESRTEFGAFGMRRAQ